MYEDFLLQLIDKSEISLGYLGHTASLKGRKVSKPCSGYFLIYILSGKYAITINNRKYIAYPNDIFLLTPHAHLELFTDKNSEYIVQQFTFLITGKASLIGELEDYMLSTDQSALADLFKKYSLDTLEADSMAPAALKSVIRMIVLEIIFCNKKNYEKIVSPLDERFINAIQYIHANPGTRMSISSLASIAGFSPSYFARYFKKHMGVTVGQYVDHVQMYNAKQLLIHTQLPVKEITCRLGFSDHSAFSKKFKKHFGFSPAKAKEMWI